MPKTNQVVKPNIFKRIVLAYKEKQDYKKFVEFINKEKRSPISAFNKMGIEFNAKERAINFIITIPDEFIDLSDFEISNIVAERQRSYVEFLVQYGFGDKLSLDAYTRFTIVNDNGKMVSSPAIGVIYQYEFVYNVNNFLLKCLYALIGLVAASSLIVGMYVR